jgi:hypothetical protein
VGAIMSATISRRSLLLILAALVLASMLPLIAQQLPNIHVPIPAHAVERHGADATLANQCLNGRQGYLFYNKTTDRRAVVCWLDDRWGFVILDKDSNEITSFVSNKLKSIEKVIEYMDRQGYR